MIYTLLEAVQLILSSLDADEVDSVSDTIESNQVSLILKSVYYDMLSEIDTPDKETMFQLNASGDNTKPCLMFIPTNITKIFSVMYNIKEDTESHPNYRQMEYVTFPEFLRRMQGIREGTSTGSMTVTNNGESFTVLFRKDEDPRHYTTTDDLQYIFNAFDETKDTTLQKSKTLCLGISYPTWSMTDTFIPDLVPQQFALWINKSKVRAHQELKQILNQEAISETKNQKMILQKRKRKTENLSEVKKAGRYGRK